MPVAPALGNRRYPGLVRAFTGVAGSPVLITIDPTEVTGALLRADFDAAAASLRGHLDPGVWAEIATGCDAGAGCGDIAQIAEHLRAAQHRVVRHAADHAGLPHHLRSMLCDRFADYLGYLVAAARGPVPDGSATVLASADHPLPAWYGDDTPRLPIDHDNMLGDQRVADLVFAAIEKGH